MFQSQQMCNKQCAQIMSTYERNKGSKWNLTLFAEFPCCSLLGWMWQASLAASSLSRSCCTDLINHTPLPQSVLVSQHSPPIRHNCMVARLQRFNIVSKENDKSRRPWAVSCSIASMEEGGLNKPLYELVRNKIKVICRKCWLQKADLNLPLDLYTKESKCA